MQTHGRTHGRTYISTSRAAPSQLKIEEIKLSSPHVHTFYFFREVIIHPNLDQNTLENNFGIIKLDSDVNFSNRIAPICLPTATTNYDDVVATLTGWGRETLAGFDLAILQKAGIDLLTLFFILFVRNSRCHCVVDICNNICSINLWWPTVL